MNGHSGDSFTFTLDLHFFTIDLHLVYMRFFYIRQVSFKLRYLGKTVKRSTLTSAVGNQGFASPTDGQIHP